MDPITSRIFSASLYAMMIADPWHTEVPLDEKLKKAWKVAHEATDFLAKKVRNARNKTAE